MESKITVESDHEDLSEIEPRAKHMKMVEFMAGKVGEEVNDRKSLKDLME